MKGGFGKDRARLRLPAIRQEREAVESKGEEKQKKTVPMGASILPDGVP